jgi:hypothetical protein
MNLFVQTANAENKLRKTNKCKNKINYKNTLKGKNNQTKTWKCISINIEEYASKCTDQCSSKAISRMFGTKIE